MTIESELRVTQRSSVRIKRPRVNSNLNQAPDTPCPTITIIGGPHLHHERLKKLFDELNLINHLNKSSGISKLE